MCMFLLHDLQHAPVCACGSAALSSDGTVFCWGAAADGQTGTAGATGAGPTAAPAPVLGPRAAVSAGSGRDLLEPCVCARPSMAWVFSRVAALCPAAQRTSQKHARCMCCVQLCLLALHHLLGAATCGQVRAAGMSR